MALKDDLESCNQRNKELTSRVESLQKRLEDITNSRIQLYLSYATGIVFVLILLYLAIGVTEPTNWQYTLFRTILSLGAAGIAALLPGDIEIKYKNLLRATGALAVFLFVYKINPAELAGIPEPTPTSSFQFKILTKQDSGQVLNCFTLPYSDVIKSIKDNKIFDFISQYMEKYAQHKVNIDDLIFEG
jgi:hypothetical protein